MGSKIIHQICPQCGGKTELHVDSYGCYEQCQGCSFIYVLKEHRIEKQDLAVCGNTWIGWSTGNIH